MDKRSLLITIPHGGDKIPAELERTSDLNSADVFWDSDGATKLLYGFKDRTWVVETDIARAYVDMNRDRTDLAPNNPDGVIKSQTCLGVPVYKPGKFPDQKLIEQLLQNYYDPFHRRINEVLGQKNVVLAIDCHSMLPQSPGLRTYAGTERPLFCLSNGGNGSGLPIQPEKPITCPAPILSLLKQLLVEEFSIAESQVLLNDPFNGGYIVRSHHLRSNKPWIQFEINRKLYLKFNKVGTPSYLVPDKTITNLREKIWGVFTRLTRIL